MELILPSLAERLKPLRKEKKKTQKDMAALLGITERHYQKIEYGHINISATMLITLADYFHVRSTTTFSSPCPTRSTPSPSRWT